MIEESIEDVAENILYELLIYSEWLQDPELQAKGAIDKNEETNNAGRGFQNWFTSWTTESCPPDLIHRLINLQMPWSFAVGGQGAVIAILQDSHLEIRTSRDEYGAIIGRTQVNKDQYPQWRKIQWSPDCTMLALAYSSGKIDFYDLIGAFMFSIEAAVSTIVNSKVKLQHSIVGMAFSDVRVKNTQWSYEFLTADYEGTIRGYYISPLDGHKESHVFSLSSCYPMGISAFVYHSTDNILLICGKSVQLSHLSHSNDASQMGLSVWRFISGYPYYKLALSLDEQMNYSKTSTWNIIFNKISGGPKQDLIFKMSVSPNGKILAAVHLSGALSLWDLPSLRLKKYWVLQLQPNYADMNPHCCEPGMKKKFDFLMLNSFQSHIIDINWWSNEAIIMVRVCGAVTVSSINSLRNLLGISPEWFEPSPAVTSFYNGGFLAIECEVKMKNMKRSFEDKEDDDESSDDDEPSIFAYGAEMAQKALYFITDSDRFRPPKKKMKKITKTYRLLCLKSTTPEELYSRKINNEEYGEALVLAQTYNLDCDLVYQKQWRKMPATVETIHDYLSKITKRSWVLHECIERVPENFEAAKELLLFGLQGTDLKALIAIGKGEDHGRFILCSPYDNIPSDFDSSLSYNLDIEEVEALKKDYQEKKQAELLKQINFKKLTLEQKQLCLSRLKLLTYLDKLTAYEAILGGPLMAYEQYDHKFFKLFRSQCGLEAAIYFASNSNWEAIATLFTYNGAETLPHRMPILSFFPETTNPADYQTLLPLFNEHESTFYPWDEHQIREPDWCELKYQKNVPSSTAEDDFVEIFYEKYDNLIKYRQFPLTGEIVTEWYSLRAKEIEDKTSLIDNALELVKLGVQRNIQGLEKLHDDLLTLEVLIYECSITSDISLQEYEELSAFEKIKLMMSTTTDVNFIKNVQQWLLPFLNRCEKYEPSSEKMLLKTYILSISKNDLCYCKKIVDNSCCEASIISDFIELVSLGLDCIYYCERSDQVKVVKEIYDLITTIPDLRYKCMAKNLQSLLDDLDDLKKHISIAEILDKNNCFVTLSTMKNISKNEEEVKKLLIKLTRMASHRYPSLDENGWNLLLSDVLEMQQILFKCITFEDCYEIVLQSLLCSGKPENITYAGKMMECNKKQKKREEIIGQFSFKLRYMNSVKLVLAASQEYFNSSASPNDPCMALARACLNLIEDLPTSIEEELDLIASISLLQDFNVNVLPLQVRLCENRISLIQEALKKNNKSYKKSRKIMKLAYLLRAWSKDSQEREGKVLTLIAERAFEVKDYAESFQASKQIMEKGYKDGWSVCNTLGSCEEFDNIPARCELLSFSLSFCSEDHIESILKRRSELQLQVLQSRVKYFMGDDAVQLYEKSSLSLDVSNLETDVNGTNSLWQTSGKTLQVLQNTTTQTTKAVLTSVKSAKFWKDAVNWIQPLGISWKDDVSDIEENCNKSLNKQGTCDFYTGIIDNFHISKFEASYQRYARPDFHQSLEIAFCIFRACLLEDFLKYESSKTSVENRVIIDIARAFLPEDLVSSLCVLLSLKEAEEAESFLTLLPSTPLVFQFASLYYAIKLMNELHIAHFSVDDENDLNPLDIIKTALDVEKSVAVLSVKGEKYLSLLQKYNKMLYDFIQAEVLHSIGGGVDATRFTTDDVYKKDTILGISMTLDDEVFHTAVSLAHHYNVSLWDLYITHLEYLFSEPNVSSSNISERLEKLNLLEKLLEKKKLFQSHLQNNIYPGIHGQDHDKLNLCFLLLETCGDNKDKLGIAPSHHKKLLNKFKSAMKSINYKLLMCAETSLSYLASIINESNAHVFAKSSENIPKTEETFYEPGNIFCLWLQKYFFEGNSASFKVPTTKTEWIHRYESCSDTMQRLGPDDILEFIHHIIFSDQALEKMSVDCRAEVVKRCIKFCRSKCTKSKNNIELSSSWNDTSDVLSDYFHHLQRMEDETLKQLWESMDSKIRSYCKEFDTSKSNTEKLQNLLVRIVLEGPDLASLKNFLSCCPENIDWEPTDAYLKAIYVILLQMKEPQSDSYQCFKTATPIHILDAILKDISDKKEELMIEDMAVEILNEFCQDGNVSVSIRLSILQLLEKTNCLSPEYGSLLLLYRTQAIISSVWPDIEISEEEVKDYSERIILLNCLIAKCKTMNHFTALAKLLNYWPSFPQEQFQDHLDEPYTKVLSGLISLSDGNALNAAVEILESALSSPPFNFQCSKEIFERIKEKGNILHILKTALKTEYVELHNAALDVLKTKSEITPDDYDNELLDLILKQSLVVKIISTGLYKPVIEFLLHCQDDRLQENYKSIDNVIKELHEAGYASEAGSLLQIKCSTHTSLSTFTSAIHVLHRWISENKS